MKIEITIDPKDAKQRDAVNALMLAIAGEQETKKPGIDFKAQTTKKKAVAVEAETAEVVTAEAETAEVVTAEAEAAEAEAVRVKTAEAEAARVKTAEAEAARVKTAETEAARVKTAEAEAVRVKTTKAETRERLGLSVSRDRVREILHSKIVENRAAIKSELARIEANNVTEIREWDLGDFADFLTALP
jgi:hypothetical protein